MSEIEWNRACPRNKIAALVLLPWERGVTVVHRDDDGKLWGCRDVSFGVDHEACLNAWTEDALRQGFKVEDRRGFPSWCAWLCEQLGTDKWCVAARTSGRTARYEVVLTPKRYSKFERDYRAKYGAIHVMGIG